MFATRQPSVTDMRKGAGLPAPIYIHNSSFGCYSTMVVVSASECAGGRGRFRGRPCDVPVQSQQRWCYAMELCADAGHGRQRLRRSRLSLADARDRPVRIESCRSSPSSNDALFLHWYGVRPNDCCARFPNSSHIRRSPDSPSYGTGLASRTLAAGLRRVTTTAP